MGAFVPGDNLPGCGGIARIAKTTFSLTGILLSYQQGRYEMTTYATIYTHCGRAFTALAEDMEYLPRHQAWKMHKITYTGTQEWFLRKIYVAEVIHHNEKFE